MCLPFGEREAEKLRDVLQKFLQALARGFLINTCGSPSSAIRPLSIKSGAKLLSRQNRFRVSRSPSYPFFSQILHNLQHFMAQFRVRAEVGSSNSIIFGFTASARAWPHAAVDHQKVRKGSDVHVRQTDFRQQLTCQFFRLFFVRPRTRSGPNMTFSSAVRCGKSKTAGTPYPLPGESGARQLSVVNLQAIDNQIAGGDFFQFVMQRSRVDLPEPEGPIITTTSPEQCSNRYCAAPGLDQNAWNVFKFNHRIFILLSRRRRIKSAPG